MTTAGYWAIFTLTLPEVFLVVAAMAVLFVDLAPMQGMEVRARRLVGALIATVGCGAALFLLLYAAPSGNLAGGFLHLDGVARIAKAGILLLTVCVAWLSVESRSTEHIGEFFCLVLFAAVGMLFLASAENLLMIFVALELTSLSLYALAGFDRERPESSEAAIKYFLFGGLSAATTLFGFSLLYGLTGSLELRGVAEALHSRPVDPLLALALVMSLAGFGFKVAAVPFHLWAPDAYQGAPTPAAALIASGSKVASFAVLAKIVVLGLGGVAGSGAWRQFAPGWAPLLATLAVASMVWGNLAALAQTDLRRLIAYSAIAHAGYALLGVVAGTPQATAAVVYYVITYGFAVVGAFGVVGALEAQGQGTRLVDLAGLRRRAPVLAFCLLVFVLSLAGIPPLAGFFGKFYVFAAVARAGDGSLGLLWLVIIALGMSTVSLYYYLMILKQAYVVDAATEQGGTTDSWTTWLPLAVMALLVVLTGAFPDVIVGPLAAGVGGVGHP